MGRGWPPRRRHIRFRQQRPSPGPRGTWNTREKRARSAHRPAEAAPGAHKASDRIFCARTNFYIIWARSGQWSPRRRRRSSFRWQRPSPGPRGTWGTRGPHTRPLSRLAERRAPLSQSFWQCQKLQIVGVCRPPMARRCGLRRHPATSGTQGTRGPGMRCIASGSASALRPIC